MICSIKLFTVIIVTQESIKNAMGWIKIFWKAQYSLKDPRLKKSIFKSKTIQKKGFHVICVLQELEKEKILMTLDV